MPCLIFVLLCSTAVITVAKKCATPNDEEAECTSLYNCTHLLEALRTLEPKSVEFVQKSQCGYDTHPLVCCGSSIKNEESNTQTVEIRPTASSHSTTSHTPQSQTDSKLKLLPSRRYCGYQRFDDYFHTENLLSTSSIDQFPWMAALIYESNGKPFGYGCAGSLISKRYVLTAGHCLNATLFNLVAVRLGEYNIKKDEDCIKNEQFYECTDPVADFGIEEIIIHSRWHYATMQNDIGLIRLNKTVVYTDFIRPICLPFPGTKFAKIGENLTLSGWGRKSSLEDVVVEIKKKVSAELRPLEECLESFKNWGVILTDNHNCIKEMETATVFTCRGDSGSPVMFFHRNQWHQEGIVSFARTCGGRFPSVNTKVSNYLNWILDNVKR